LLFRFCSELVFCFDGDDAGRQAAWKAADAALPCLRDGRQIKIMLLPQGHDPDSLIRNEGLQAFEEQIGSARVLSDYFFDFLTSGLQLTSVEGKSQLLTAARPQLEKLPAGFFRDMMFGRLSELAGVKRLDVGEKRSTLKPQSLAKSPKHSAQKPSLQRWVLAALIQFPHLAQAQCLVEEGWQGLQFAGRELLENLLRVIALEKPENSAILLEAYRGSDDEKRVKLLSAMELNIPDGEEIAMFSGAWVQLLRQVRQEKLHELLAKERQEGLNGEEKQALRALLQQRL